MYPKIGSVVEISIERKPKEGIIGGYNFGLSGEETSFYFQDLPNMRFPIEFLRENFTVLSEPVEDEEELI